MKDGTIQNFISCLSGCVDATQTYNKRHDEYDGYSWDWSGHEQKAVDDAIGELKGAFSDIFEELAEDIAERVQK